MKVILCKCGCLDEHDGFHPIGKLPYIIDFVASEFGSICDIEERLLNGWKLTTSKSFQVLKAWNSPLNQGSL